MSREGLSKPERHRLMSKYIEGNPLLTDDDLAHILSVSIQTIRLDRGELNIPEMRARMSSMARGVYGNIKSIESEELVGELVDLEVGRSGISVLTITEELTLRKSNVARGHLLFAQANSLAVALVDARVALTGTCKVSFKRPVVLGEKVVSRAFISQKKGNKYMVRVFSRVKDDLVMAGKFLIFAFEQGEGKA